MSMKTEITRDDILSMEDYVKIRLDRRKAIVAMKKPRRLHIGPDATFYFENFDTMWQQIHEMLYIEKGGEDQIQDELAAYNPLIPKGQELVATLMFEIDDPDRRENFLSGLGGVEETVTIEFEGETITAVPEADVDRTSADGKASSVQFLHFPFTENQIAKFKQSGTRVTLGINHSKYGHIAILSEETRMALAGDFA